MEIKGYGQVAIDEAMKIYATYDGIREVSMDALMLENMEITFVVAEKQICAILLTEPAKIENIRVLLLDNDNMFRSDVSLVSDVPVHLYYGETETVIRSRKRDYSIQLCQYTDNIVCFISRRGWHIAILFY